METHFIEEDAKNKLRNVSLDRSNIYAFLARSFQWPTLDFAQKIVSGTFYSKVEDSLQWIMMRESLFTPFLEKLNKISSKEVGISPEEFLKDLEAEYMRLFLIPSPTVISLYESDYSNIQRQIILESVIKSYNGETTHRLISNDLFPDHISIELGFLSYLSKREGRSWKKGNVQQAKNIRMKEHTFIMNHLNNWSIVFFENVERNSIHPFYQVIASLGKTFMILEIGNDRVGRLS